MAPMALSAAYQRDPLTYAVSFYDAAMLLADAMQKTAAGASLVQLYTGLIYRGPKLVDECVDAIRRRKESPSSGRVPVP